MASHVKSDESVRENVTETDSINQSVFSLDPNEEYKMDHKKRGMALIFNHENFYWQLMLNSRSGTNADRQNLVRRFQELGFEVKACDDYKREEVLSTIREAAAANHVDADCFVCVFLSHGENGHIFANDGQIQIQEITDLFKGNKCRSLVGKPKIFILQACRGDKHDDAVTPMDVVDSQTDIEVVVDAGALCTLPAGADFLMCYSVAEGYYSHRETVNGSWYIQDLCEILRHYGSTLEFTDILTLVNRKVSNRSVDNCKDRSALGKKQVPCFASMLTKKLFFGSKK
ncbi:caspase-6-like isoform X2 [Sinocyclocheilus rhinocerous]|uniref:caspase-6-like isoform X2 n=1 Tax=Sinocyclocheilus rhinocerous TaxID=307959 RepID=UPI0007B953CE|nr:PREDICTED: caspase-6-like isoform X2 [Sinocyclocheilus rhinocerous]